MTPKFNQVTWGERRDYLFCQTWPVTEPWGSQRGVSNLCSCIWLFNPGHYINNHVLCIFLNSSPFYPIYIGQSHKHTIPMPTRTGEGERAQLLMPQHKALRRRSNFTQSPVVVLLYHLPYKNQNLFSRPMHNRVAPGYLQRMPLTLTSI